MDRINRFLMKRFSVRRGTKITLMGQNGAGKSTIFHLITGELKPESGAINIDKNITIAISRQVIPRDQIDLTIREFFEKVFLKPLLPRQPPAKIKYMILIRE